MAPLSAIFFLFFCVVTAIAAPIAVPHDASNVLPPFSAVEAQASSDDTLSVAARGIKFISGGTLPPVDKSVFKRGLFPLFGGFGRSKGKGNGNGNGFGNRFGLIPGLGGGGGCQGGGCFLEKPKSGKNKGKDSDASAADSDNASPNQLSSSSPSNVSAKANVSKGGKAKGGRTGAGRGKGSAKASGGN